MTLLTKEAFVKGMRALQGRFPKGQHPNAEAINWYYDYFKNRVTDDAFLAACEKAFAELDRFPKPAALYDLCPHHVGHHALPAPEVVDPHRPVIVRAVKGTPFYHSVKAMFSERSRRGTIVDPFSRDGYPLPQVEFVEGFDE